MGSVLRLKSQLDFQDKSRVIYLPKYPSIRSFNPPKNPLLPSPSPSCPNTPSKVSKPHRNNKIIKLSKVNQIRTQRLT